MTPNPGHPDAVADGCLCPIMDNAHGRWPGPWGWWITPECPLHGAKD